MSWNVIYQDDHEAVYLDPIVKSIRWSGDVKQAARKLVVELTNTDQLRDRLVSLEKGNELRLLIGDQKELFRGVIFADSMDSGGQMTLTAYDENIYLTKSKDSKIFREQKASEIIKRLCNEFSVPMGQIDDTGFVIPKLIYRDKTLFEMMVMSLTVSEKQNGQRFLLSSREGKLLLLARKEQTVKWVLENGVNIVNASYSQSIEEMKTQVKVTGGDPKKKELSASVKDQELIKRYGVMQHLEKAKQDMTKSQIEQLAKQLLKDLATIDDEARVQCLGIDEVVAGSAVYVKEAITGIVGGYYVSSDEHSFGNGSHTMSLTLSATDDLPKMEYSEPKGDGASGKN
jgi:hypothetical protein